MFRSFNSIITYSAHEFLNVFLCLCRWFTYHLFLVYKRSTADVLNLQTTFYLCFLGFMIQIKMNETNWMDGINNSKCEYRASGQSEFTLWLDVRTFKKHFLIIHILHLISVDIINYLWFLLKIVTFFRTNFHVSLTYFCRFSIRGFNIIFRRLSIRGFNIFNLKQRTI